MIIVRGRGAYSSSPKHPRQSLGASSEDGERHRVALRSVLLLGSWGEVSKRPLRYFWREVFGRILERKGSQKTHCFRLYCPSLIRALFPPPDWLSAPRSFVDPVRRQCVSWALACWEYSASIEAT